MSKTKDVYEDLKEYVEDIKKRISLQENTLLELRDDIRGIERVKIKKRNLHNSTTRVRGNFGREVII